eukprot:scaffold5668_cov19-Tisochrysis_lutea.AAC.1
MTKMRCAAVVIMSIMIGKAAKECLLYDKQGRYSSSQFMLTIITSMFEQLKEVDRQCMHSPDRARPVYRDLHQPCRQKVFPATGAYYKLQIHDRSSSTPHSKPQGFPRPPPTRCAQGSIHNQ